MVNTFSIFGFRGGSQSPSYQVNRGTTDRDFFYPREIAGEMLGESLLDETVTYDGIPYLWKMDSNTASLYEFTEQEAAYEMDLIRLQADTMIRTLRLGK